MNYQIKVIEHDDKNFAKICDLLEKDIVKENLSVNGGTLNYAGLTYDSNPLLVAISNGEIIGFNSLVEYEDTYYIWQIAVKKKYQGQGVGTILMKKAMELAKEKDWDVTANVRDYNTSSKKMFLNLGFEKIGYSEEGNGFYIYRQMVKKM